MKYIAIDVGNTTIKVLEKNHQYKEYFFNELSELFNAITINSNQPFSVIISDVRNNNEELFQKHFSNAQQFFYNEKHQIKFPITINYSTPETLGYDRIALAVAAYNLFPNTDCLIISAGTAITIDILHRNCKFVGGAISPGINMRYKALHTFTGKLPLLNKPENIQYPGSSTFESIHNGVILGVVYEIEKHIEKHIASFPSSKIILTGGDAIYLQKFLKYPIFAKQNLVLEGLINILEYNV